MVEYYADEPKKTCSRYNFSIASSHPTIATKPPNHFTAISTISSRAREIRAVLVGCKGCRALDFGPTGWALPGSAYEAGSRCMVGFCMVEL